jgi:hypothetical protein
MAENKHYYVVNEVDSVMFGDISAVYYFVLHKVHKMT